MTMLEQVASTRVPLVGPSLGRRLRRPTLEPGRRLIHGHSRRRRCSLGQLEAQIEFEPTRDR